MINYQGEQMNKKLFLFVLTALLIVAGMFAQAQANKMIIPAATNYGAGSLTGALMADMANISYTDLSVIAQSTTNHRTIDRMLVRSAFSLRAAVILMDSHDSMWEAKTGLHPVTRVSGMESINLDDNNVLSQFKYNPATNTFSYTENNLMLPGASVNDTDGDIGSNATLGEDSYQATIDHTNFNGAYSNLNQTVEHLNSAYLDLTRDLLETNETANEWQESGNDLVVAGVSDMSTAIEKIMKERISIIEGNLPVEYIRLDDYTLSEAYLEEIMSDSLSKDIIQAYTDAKSEGGFLSSFKLKSPLKVSRVGTGQGIDAFRSDVSAFRKSQPKAFDNVIGNTAVASALAFKDIIIPGTRSALVGVKEKTHTAVKKVTNSVKTAASKIGSKIGNIKHKAFAWFNALKSKLKWIIIAVVILLVLALLFFIYVNFVIPMKATRRF